MHLVIEVINKTEIATLIEYEVYTFDELTYVNHDKTIQYHNNYETNTEVFVLDTENPAYIDVVKHIIDEAHSNMLRHKLKLRELQDKIK